MLRHCWIFFALALSGACSEDPAVPSEPISEVDPAARPSAPVVETRPPVPAARKKKDKLLRAVPGNALLCAHLPDLERGFDRLGGTVFGAFLGGLDLVDVTLRLRPLYEQMAATGGMTPPPWKDFEQVIQSLKGEVLVALLDLDGFDRRVPDLRALFGVTVDGAGKSARTIIDFFVGLAGQQIGTTIDRAGNVWEIRSNDTPYVFEIGVEGDVVLFGVGAGTVRPALEGLRGPESSFRMASQRCFHDEDIARFHIDVARILERYERQLPAAAKQALAAIRLDRVRAYSAALRIEKQDFVSTTFLDSPGGHDIFTRCLAANPVDYALLEQLPEDVTSYSLFSLDPAWIVRNLRTGLPPEQAAALEQGLTRLKADGLDLSEKVLSNFGPEAAQIGLSIGHAATSQPEAVFAGLAHSAWLIKIRNPVTVYNLLNQLSQLIPARRRYRIGKSEALTFNLGLPDVPGLTLDPSFAVSGRFLYVALSEPTLRRALEVGSDEHAKTLRSRLKDIPSGATSVTWDSMKSPGMFGAALMAALDTLRRSGRRDPVFAKLERLEAAMANLTPATAFTIADETGIFSQTKSPTAGLSGMGGVAGMAIIASIAIPNLLSARTAANESAAIATLMNIRSAQEQFRASGLRDRDRDDAGEYAHLAELMNPPRGAPLISKVNGAGGRYLRNGYIFRSFLPGPQGRPVGESKKRDENVDANLAERFFLVMAWPMEKGRTGRRAFILNTNGEIFFCADGAYGGRLAPDPDILSFEPGNMVSRTLDDGALARDGQNWHRLR